MKIVAVVSANAEWNALKSLFPGATLVETPFGERFEVELDSRKLTFFQGGWGKVSAAASAQFVIDHLQPDLIVNLGTCGGFQGRIEQGAVILVERTIIYDIVEQMGDPAQAIEQYATHLDLSWLPLNSPSDVSRGLMVSGDRDIVVADIPMLIEKYDAVAADWESGAIAWVAQKNEKRVLILRGVTDLVGGDGDDVYGDYELYMGRTKEIMGHLTGALPGWLKGIEQLEHASRF